MTLLAIDRSTGVQSFALAKDGAVFGMTVEGPDARSADWPVRIREFLSGHGCGFSDLDRIVVGTGPGSFAGIRGALAFAQGLSIGIKAGRSTQEDGPVVYGLPSAAALAQENGISAVVGDARRGLFWVVVYKGAETVSDFRLVRKDELVSAVPESASVATPDGDRIGEALQGLFGDRYVGGRSPAADRLARIALDCPDILVREPLPVYLSPAVRT